MATKTEPKCGACGITWDKHIGIMGICRAYQDLKTANAAHRLFLGVLGQVLLPTETKPTPAKILRAAEKLAAEHKILALHNHQLNALTKKPRRGGIVSRPHR